MKDSDVCGVIKVVDKLYSTNDVNDFHIVFMQDNSKYLHRCVGRFADSRMLRSITTCKQCRLISLCGFMYDYFWYKNRSDMIRATLSYSLLGEALEKLKEEFNIE